MAVLSAHFIANVNGQNCVANWSYHEGYCYNFPAGVVSLGPGWFQGLQMCANAYPAATLSIWQNLSDVSEVFNLLG